MTWHSWELRYYVVENGRKERKSTYVKGNEVDAQRKLREIGAAVDRGVPITASRITVAEFLERWLRDYVTPNTRPRTAQRYESDIRLHITPAIGHLQLAHLRAPDIQQLKAELLANGKATSSVRHVLVLLKEALKHALRWGLINVNVADAVDLPKLEQREIQPPSVEEVRDILALAKPPMA